MNEVNVTGDTRCCPRVRYRTIVRGLLPWCDGPELDLRCSILLLRDQATQSVRHCSYDAVSIYEEIVRLACVYGLGSTLTVAKLNSLRRTLLRLTLAAGELDALASADADGHDGVEP